MPPSVPHRLAFDDIVIDLAGRRLSRAGQEQALEPKAFAVLALLLGAPGRVFSRDEILDAIWGHRHVTQSVLNRIMSLLRQALGEDAAHPRLLHTVYGIGYRFDLPATTTTTAAGGQADSAAPDVAVMADTTAGVSKPHRARWRGLAAVAFAALLVLAAIAWLPRKPWQTTPDRSANPPSLAVLPFEDLSRSADQRYLADGLAEEILNQLAQAPSLRVVGRTSSFSFKGKHETPRAIGHKLGVAHLLQGSVRKEGDHLRVTAQLLRADDGSYLWSKTYTRELRDVFAMQDEISRDVALALSVRLNVSRFNREQGGTTNVEVYQRYLHWRGLVMAELFDLEHDRERLRLAREMVAMDPHCVLCRDALAVSLNAMAQELGGTQARQLKAEALQVRAQIAHIAPDSWVARRDRSNTLWREGKRAEAIALARQIAESGPPTKERVWDYAYMIYAMGHLDETIALVEQVRAAEPMALYLSRDLQYDYTAARRYADAESEYLRGRSLEGSQLEPDAVAFFRQLAGKRAGGLDELRGLHQRLLGKSQDFDTRFFAELGQVLDNPEAMLALVRKALTDTHYGGGVERAYMWTSVADALGDADLAMASLRAGMHAQEGFKQGAMAQIPYVAFWNAPYSTLRAHPDFKKLLIEAGVADYWRQSGHWGDGCRPVGAQDFQCR